jgi:hypothetical protein
MGGVKITAAISAALACAWLAASAQAGEADGVRALAREKAAAVAILKEKAADAVVTLAQDRVFVAYLNATTQGEGARLRARMTQAFETLTARVGIRSVAMIDRSGEVIVRTGGKAASTSVDPVVAAGVSARVDPVVAAGFALKPRLISSTVAKGADASAWTLSLVAPISWRGQNEFVLRAVQSGAVYSAALARGVGGQRYVVLADRDGRVLSDSRSKSAPKAAFAVAGLPLAALRKALKGDAQEGSGQVSRKEERFNVSYRAVDNWTVVAVEPTASPRRCVKNGDRLCG